LLKGFVEKCTNINKNAIIFADVIKDVANVFLFSKIVYDEVSYVSPQY